MPHMDPNMDESDQKALQERLNELRRQTDEIEHRKRAIDELKSKEKEFEEGRRTVLEKLERGLVILENQEFEAKREAEQLRQIREAFNEQLQQIREVDPNEWKGGRDTQSVQAEVTRALARVDQAHAIYTQARSRLAKFGEVEATEGDEYLDGASEKSFVTLMKEGFAFTLPLMLFATAALFIFILIQKLSAAATP
ncbi:hypothetical protein DB346_17070 [Verrucomicrobia bacterium LW23]|nr:hypothetical protein DB346_17070 [Verrucomicrobia bacterium LW23]